MQINNSRIALISLGRKGGSTDLLLSVVADIKEAQIPFTIVTSMANESLSQIRNYTDDFLLLKTSKNFIIAIYHVILLLFKPPKILNELKGKRIQQIYFLQPHYLDFVLIRHLKALNIQVGYVIHDAYPHPGEWFPPRFLTLRIAKMSDSVICLNSDNFEDMKRFSKSVCLSKLPKYSSKLSTLEVSFLKQNVSIDLLFIGRIREYKGINNFLHALSLLGKPELRTVIAGEGTLPKKFLVEIELVNRWLDLSEMEKLICAAKFVVLPYIEASQSGIIEMCKTLNTPIIVTPVGGLESQIRDGGTGVIASGTSPKCIMDAICRALEGKIDYFPSAKHTPYLSELIIKRNKGGSTFE